MRRTIFFVLLLAVGFIEISIEGQSLKIHLIGGEKYILGEEITFSQIWENASEKPLFVIAENGLPARKTSVKYAGKTRKDCIRGGPLEETETTEIATPIPPKAFAPKETICMRSICAFDCGIVDEGEYEIWVEFDTTNLPEKLYKAGYEKIKVESNHIKFRIVKPTGIDLEVYEKYHNSCNQIALEPAKLLQKYPTSTYAAYLIYKRLGNFAHADFNDSKFMRSIETGFFLSNSYPTECGWIWMKGEDNANWWTKWIGIILKNHPDIWFADELRLKLAVNEVALKRYKSGEAMLEKLSKEGKPYVADKAKEFMKIMEEKGWKENGKIEEKEKQEIKKE